MNNGKSVKVGKVFTFLTVKLMTEERSNGCRVWTCECKCGKIINIRTDYLQQGWSKSCGCLRSQRAKDRIPEVWNKNFKKNQDNEVYRFNELIKSYMRGAKNRNIDFNLSKEEIYEIVTMDCHYCGVEPKKSDVSKKYVDYFSGIDRKDNSLGYTKSNSVACCGVCNRAKNNMNYGEFLSYTKQIFDFIKRGINA